MKKLSFISICALLLLFAFMFSSIAVDSLSTSEITALDMILSQSADAEEAAEYSIIGIEEGHYYIQNVGSGLYMDIEGPSIASGAALQQWNYNGSTQSQWTVTLLDDGYYVIKSAYSNLYMGLDSANTSLVKQYSTVNDYTKWIPIETNAGNYILVCKITESTNYVAAAPDTANASNLVQSSYVIDTNYLDEWTFIPVETMEEGIVHTFCNVSQDKLLKPGTTSAGSAAIVSTIDYSDTTFMWRFEHAGNGYYKIKNESTGYYLTAPNSNTSGASVTQAASSTGEGQLWVVIQNSDGSYKIQSKDQRDRVTTAPLYLTVSGTNAVQSSTTTAIAWNVKPLTLSVNVLHDQVFVYRFTSNHCMSVLNAFFAENSNGLTIADMLKEYFGIKLNVTFSSSIYESYPWKVDCAHKTSQNMICMDCKNLAEDTEENECMLGYHHKSNDIIIGDLPGTHIYLSEDVNILFTGYKTCDIDDTGNHKVGYVHAIAGRSYSHTLIATGTFNSSAASSHYDGITATTMHELMHNIGRGGHCEDGENTICIMEEQSDDARSNLKMCDACKSIVNDNKLNLYNHN